MVRSGLSQQDILHLPRGIQHREDHGATATAITVYPPLYRNEPETPCMTANRSRHKSGPGEQRHPRLGVNPRTQSWASKAPMSSTSAARHQSNVEVELGCAW